MHGYLGGHLMEGTDKYYPFSWPQHIHRGELTAEVREGAIYINASIGSKGMDSHIRESY